MREDVTIRRLAIPCGDETELSAIRQVLEAFREPSILLSPDYRILAANTAYQEVYGTDADGSSRACHEASHGYQRPCDEAARPARCKRHSPADAGSVSCMCITRRRGVSTWTWS